MGMAYLADKIREFGDVHLALASYNAGERAVRRWTMERPGVPQDEFIDDIPYPQTQLYVKKILGTAEDYRRLYGSDSSPVLVADAIPALSRGAQSPAQGAASTPPPAKKKAAAPPATTTRKKKVRRAA